MNKDIRNIRTEFQLKQALITLINSKGFNNLTVSDISRTAGINRGTFYIHYLDKYDLLKKVELNILANLRVVLKKDYANISSTIPQQKAQAERLFSTTFAYLARERATFKALASEKGDPSFLQNGRMAVKNEFHSRLKLNNGYLTNLIPADYAEALICNSLFDIFMIWINKKDPESPTEIARIINTSRSLAPNQLANFD
ncbi:TetR/AcrR family transcriptional regulator [Liquorilactobacillus satsumensis]|uniref:Transcriptional regulator n=2 Tax=Liquorilactobacillus satsumensis TaxID=259059 RepID=A0A0R1V0H5_9LACO|nr:TetR/AcrR family transcriptional regulator [Liquorilactobacillus satsumensis]KRL97178.1 transcriptional regulator [Liquorilactobacillus satsumensis DSM 16230 = JCM 12392]MCC7667740.1 TetR/AcrR family transcriptional regulator [Liquorilactobacillus satsumensis]MCP9311920.1 TetR/AcrR family transcriptional regulator [Liquorilactobacillus satsumensis]MCP9328603.1 TetR/AcrR family transcriptional regulator [Liquorilactobacillus satsumensis]MCP9356929.1 TetR/AcrR family transcriptional regulator